MLKIFAAISASLMLVGCMSRISQVEKQEATDWKDHLKCLDYGFKKGTLDYGKCRMLVAQQRHQTDQARFNNSMAILGGYAQSQQRQGGPQALPPGAYRLNTPPIGSSGTITCHRMGNYTTCN